MSIAAGPNKSASMELFRYMSFEHRDWIVDLLERNSLYFAYPKEFNDNDAFDCKTYEIISGYFNDDLKTACCLLRKKLLEMFPREKTRSEIRRKINECGGNRAFVKRFTEDFEAVTKRSWDDTRTGILCLTSDPPNDDMWKKYCNYNNGICVCLDRMVLETTLHKVNLSSIPYLKGKILGGKVAYIDRPFKITLTEFYKDPYAHMKRMLFTKLDSFSFETETRIIIMEYGNEKQLVTFPHDLVKEVIVKKNTNSDIIAFVNDINEKRKTKFLLRVIE